MRDHRESTSRKCFDNSIYSLILSDNSGLEPFSKSSKFTHFVFIDDMGWDACLICKHIPDILSINKWSEVGRNIFAGSDFVHICFDLFFFIFEFCCSEVVLFFYGIFYFLLEFSQGFLICFILIVIV